MHADAGEQTRTTVAEVGRLLQAAGEAPRAAAEALATQRQQLGDSLARDLHERLFAWVTLGDERNLAETWVAGVRRYSRNAVLPSA